MKTVLSCFLILVSSVYAANTEPIVLIHGLGGTNASWEYAAELEESGFTTIAVNLNGYESNYDKAIELFAMLKGTKMDYGICHSQKFGHNRFGKDYTGIGLYPEWDENHKIHVIGYSMGGQTMRSLERLLEVGSECAEDTDFALQGGKNWITSLTAVAAPLDGTTGFEVIPPFTEEVIFSQFMSLYSTDIQQLAFPQWNLVPEEGEAKSDYVERVIESGIITGEDFAFYDLSVEGSLKFNREFPPVYRTDRFYFSWATERTSPVTNCDFLFMRCDTIEEPDREMSLVLHLPAGILGGTASAPIDRPNDGLVNQDRSRCPGVSSFCLNVVDDLTFINWIPGVWNYIDIGYLDHLQVVGRDSFNDLTNFMESGARLYLQHGIRLALLPTTSVALANEEQFKRNEKADSVQMYFEALQVLTQPLPDKGQSSAGGIVTVLIITTVLVVGIFIEKKYKAVKRVKSYFHRSERSDEGSMRVVSV